MKKWYIGPNIVLREEADDWGILFDPDTGNSVVLNPVAISMFKAMRKTQDIDGVAAAIRAEYTDIPESLKEDITTFVNSLAENGFIGFEASEE